MKWRLFYSELVAKRVEGDDKNGGDDVEKELQVW